MSRRALSLTRELTIPECNRSPTLANDLSFGESSEHSNLETLQTFLGTTLNRNGGYAVFDFENPGKTIFVELKTRRIRHDTYDTAIIGYNKVRVAEEGCNTNQYWFAFCYTDGIFVIQYEKELFDSFQRNDEYRRGERPDCTNYAQHIVYIPREHLRKV